MLAAWLQHHFTLVWRVVLALSATPAALLAWWYTQHNLGPNPLAFLLHTTGRCALVLLTLTLLITPLRRWLASLHTWTHRRYGKRLSDWNWLIRLRKLLGLACFFYVGLHVWLYAHFDAGYDALSMWLDIQEKPYIAAGAIGFILLVPLALTSTKSMMRRLGRNWSRLHRLIYPAAMLALLHFWWMMKPGFWTPWPETLAISVLLGYRLLMYTGMLVRWDGCDGKASLERPPRTPKAPSAPEAKKDGYDYPCSRYTTTPL